MRINVNFNNHKLWNTCSEFHKKTLSCPNIFGHILYEYYNKIDRLKNIKNAIETGTFDARTSVFFSHIFDNVDTIELYDSLNPYTNTSFSDLYSNIKKENTNINFHFGNSANVLQTIFKSNPDTSYLILLDAHTESQTPLIEELNAIKLSNKKDHVILIDDCSYLGNGVYPSESEVIELLMDINENYNIVKTNYGNGITIVY